MTTRKGGTLQVFVPIGIGDVNTALVAGGAWWTESSSLYFILTCLEFVISLP